MRINQQVANVHVKWRDSVATVYSCGADDSIAGLFSKRHLSDLLLMRTSTWSSRYLIVFSYVVNGTHFSGEFISSTRMDAGSTFPIRYDPQAPAKNDSNDFSVSWPLWGYLAGGVSLIILGAYLRFFVFLKFGPGALLVYAAGVAGALLLLISKARSDRPR